MKRVLLVDDHTIVRNGVNRLFAGCTDLIVDCEASTCDEAVALLTTRSVDGVLLDISMPDGNGLDVLRKMKSLRPDVPVLIFSMHSEAHYALNALKAGASGYIEKNNAIDEIVVAMRTVLRGRKYLSATLTDELARVAGDGDMQKAPHEKLSRREFEVFRMLASGQAVSSIGKELSLSVKTISTHRARVLSKMNLTSNASLTYYAIKNELIS